MQSDLFHTQYAATPATEPGMSLQNSKSIKYAVNGECLARQGAMIAFRGDLSFEKKGQGVGKYLKRRFTGEGLPLMAVKGRGEAWFAHEAASCFVVRLDPGDSLSVNGNNVLCFDATLSYDIRMVKGAGMTGGGLFNCVFSGQGDLGLICEGEPVVIPVSPREPVYADTDAVVGWSASLRTSLNRSQGLGSMIRGGSGEAVQLKLEGEGFVVVRPSEVQEEEAS